MIIVVCGPGGVGKGTVVAHLIAKDARLWLSRSWTTRQRRPSEREDAYVWVTREEFMRHADNGGFLEYAEFLGNLYGTPWPDGADGRDVILEIDVQGAAQVLARIPDCLFILLEPPSPEVQAERLRGRGDPPEQAEERIRVAQAELEAGRQLGAICIVNDDLERTVATVEGLIAEARSR